MASRWFCRVLDQEMGPLTFQDLVEMIRAGTLTEDDRVRRDGTSNWTRAREVIGLFRAAERESAEAAPPAGEPEPEPKPAPAPAPSKPARAERPFRKTRRLGKRGLSLILGCAIVIVVVIVTVWGWRSRASSRFPEPRLGKPRPVTEDVLASIRAPRPKVPSIAGLKEGKPKLVPGLEDFDPVHSVCLSADLRTIVFSAGEKWKENHDLYLATRDKVSDPFDTPKRIKSCVTGRWEVGPALSPDGLDLIFLRPYVKGHFFYASRATPSSEFGKPVPWLLSGLDPKRQQVRFPRFCGPLHLLFNAVDLATKEQTFLMAERAAPQSMFGAPKKVTLANFDAWAFLSEDGLRCCFGTPKGLFIAARKNESDAFARLLIVDAQVTGPIDVPVWVTPKEDVIFYCSPGAGKALGSGRKAWMIRF